jgi:hypothetical protein
MRILIYSVDAFQLAEKSIADSFSEIVRNMIKQYSDLICLNFGLRGSHSNIKSGGLRQAGEWLNFTFPKIRASDIFRRPSVAWHSCWESTSRFCQNAGLHVAASLRPFLSGTRGRRERHPHLYKYSIDTQSPKKPLSNVPHFLGVPEPSKHGRPSPFKSNGATNYCLSGM